MQLKNTHLSENVVVLDTRMDCWIGFGVSGFYAFNSECE